MVSTYSYNDGLNRLTSVTIPNGGVISFTYDPFGRRIRKVSAAGAATIYVYDGNNIEEELNADGTLGERYTYGPGVDEPLVGQRQPKIFFYEADGLGSVTSLTDPTGAITATYTYDSFGFLTNSTGSATNWFRYTARQFDSDTALYYYRARYYDPTIGRFISEDPIRFKSGVNFYRYASGNPVEVSDPSGLTNYTAQQTQEILEQAYYSATAGPFQGLTNIKNISLGTYDFQVTQPTSTFIVNGATMDAAQFGNFIAGFEGAVYDQMYSFGVPVAESAVEGVGVAIHCFGRSASTDDPWDSRGLRDIHAGERYGATYVPPGAAGAGGGSAF